ncbi:hypothetical protein LDO26_14015 [Luteimonas sp. BDR2-5]|uniref:hypothetical protein n=1 Tax=Proluteimonas luteida TaxID=2878685 RepID=UPI001E5EEC8D|nr:hypothetical protein [Luteimonas sp. BDR2-5]MCD9029314.1 hypothetical protein [Luteimonas sp. BDR2-5]
MTDIEISIVDGRFEVSGLSHHQVFTSKLRAIAAATTLAAQAADARGCEVRILVPAGWGAPYLVSADGDIRLA